MRRNLRRSLGLLAVLAAGAGACKPKNNGTMMLVEVNSDIPATQLDEIQVTATPSRGTAVTQNFPLGATVKLPVQLALVPEGEPALDVVLAIAGVSTKRTIANLVATVSFQPGKAFTAGLFLSRDCQAKLIPCPGDQQCVAGPTCVTKDKAVTIRPLGSTDDAGTPPKPDLVAERPPRDTSTVTGTWMTVSPPAFMGNLNGVHPVSDREVWVVGTGGAAGFVYRFDGTMWTPVPVPAQTRPLQAVWAAASEDVWAVGFGGTILHRVGATFSAIPSGVTTNLAAVFGTGPNDVWFVGVGKTVLHWDGTRIVMAAEGVTTDNITSGTASGPANTWIAGTGGAIYRRNGNTWQRQAEGMTTSTVFGIWSSGPDDVWAVGDGGALHFDGAAWSTANAAIPVALAVWGAADNDVWVVGRGLLGRGITAHFDGNTWTEVAAPMASALQSVRGLSASDVWAVGKEVIRYR